MIDLSNITFIIPVRLDSVDRFNNLSHVLTLIYRNFKTNVILLESDSQRKITFKPPPDSMFNLAYLFEKDAGITFHRTKYLNQMIRQATTTYIANYDCR